MKKIIYLSFLLLFFVTGCNSNTPKTIKNPIQVSVDTPSTTTSSQTNHAINHTLKQRTLTHLPIKPVEISKPSVKKMQTVDPDPTATPISTIITATPSQASIPVHYDIMSDPTLYPTSIKDALQKRLHLVLVVSKPNQTQDVLIALGKRNTGGYSIVIQQVVNKDEKTIVTYKVRKPSPGTFVPEMITYPSIVLNVYSNLPVITQAL